MGDCPAFKYPWQQAYLAALMETNPDELLVKIVSAQCAISRRLAGNDPDFDERTALDDAMHSLKFLFTQDKARRERENQHRGKGAA
jgi:hypothetical protein